jgi:Na+-translocating ferredoxin:NAD+ oxidoreductase RnfG subunit
MISNEVKRARVTAILFGALSSVALIAFVFAFIQHGVAKKNEEVANQEFQRALQCERLAKEMQLQAEQQRQESLKIQETLEQELNRLKNSRLK